jgi:aspartyl-tRNA(Asn)/glutamyl-tRNA(Gln) amidotransferase subunit A
MQVDQLAALTIAEAARAFRSRQLSPLELTRACLERIEALDGRLNAFITVLPERALAEAQEAETRLAAGQARGPLDGIPFAIKDLYETAGVRTTAGSKILADYVPQRDCTCVRRLTEAGMVLLGKLNMHEWAYGATTAVSHFGPCHNPWDLERIPGGSSGGSAAALAASLCLGSLGSDTGGSIRMPASLCGIVGLKPTYGRVSKQGVIPLSDSLDHAGPMARTVEDAALILQAIAGPDPDDPTTSDRPVPDYAASLKGDIRGLRIGVPQNDALSGTSEDVLQAVEEALRTLAGLGAKVVEVAVPWLIEATVIWPSIVGPEAAHYHRQHLEQRPDDISEQVRNRLLAGRNLLAIEYLRGLDVQRRIKADAAALFADIDLLVTPTTHVTAFPIDVELAGASPEGRLHRFTAPFDITGQPAISIPCGFDPRSLPIGLQIIGRPWEEQTVLRAAHAYEQATDWHRRRPNVA